MDERNCGRCEEETYYECDAYKCFLCLQYYHKKCEEVPGEDMVAKALEDTRGLRWVCINCARKVNRREFTICKPSTCECEKAINKRIDALEKRIEALLGGERTQTNKEQPQQQQALTWAKVVTIEPKNRKGKEKSNTREKVRKSIDPTVIHATEMRDTVSGGVKFNCAENDNSKLEKEIQGKLGANFDVTITDQRRPKVKIVGVYDDRKLKNDELEKIIKKQNDKLMSEKDYLKIVKVSPGRTNENVKTLIAEVDNGTYGRLIEAGRISINWSRCKVLDGIDIMRCYKCSRYSHKGSICSQEKCCPKCMKNHTLTEHPKEDEDEKCINCCEANKKFNLGLSENHAVWSRNCEVYKRKLNNARKLFVKI